MPWKRIVGLTGGFGSGKSTVLSMFRGLGAYTVDADSVVHGLLKDPRVLSTIRRRFGGVFFDESGDLIRSKMAALVFQSPGARRTLEKILHPLVRRTMKSVLRKASGNVAVCDIPLLFEAGWKKDFDRVIVVDAPLAVRQRRLKQKGFTAADIRDRMRAQWPQPRKVREADVVVDNGGDRRRTLRQVEKIWKQLIQEDK